MAAKSKIIGSLAAIILAVLSYIGGYSMGTDTTSPTTVDHCTGTADTRCTYGAHDHDDKDSAGMTTYVDMSGTRWYRDDDDLYAVTGW